MWASGIDSEGIRNGHAPLVSTERELSQTERPSTPGLEALSWGLSRALIQEPDVADERWGLDGAEPAGAGVEVWTT